jgi:hypothetical protein
LFLDDFGAALTLLTLIGCETYLAGDYVLFTIFFVTFSFFGGLKFLTGINVFLKEFEIPFKVLIYFGVYVLSLLFFKTFLDLSDLIAMTGKYFLPPIIIASLFFIWIYFFPLKYNTLCSLF